MENLDNGSIKSKADLQTGIGEKAGDWRDRKEKLDGRATLTRINKEGRQIRVIAAEHYSQEAANFLRKIEGEIANPEQWLFLVEGKDTDIYECKVANTIATKKGIPILNPIFSPYHQEVIRLYLASERENKVSREILFGQLATDIVNERGISKEEELEKVASILGLTSQNEVKTYLEYAAKEMNKDPETYSARIEKMRNDLMEISNALSAQVLDYFLRLYPERGNIVLYLGKDHKEIVTMDLSEIPAELRLTDREIFNLQDRSVKTKIIVPEILNAIDIPKNMKPLVIKWFETFFGDDLSCKEYVRNRGYQIYLDSDNSLHQIWGAAALLFEKIDEAESEGRELTGDEKDEIRKAFLKAAESRRQDPPYSQQGDEIEQFADNLKILVELYKYIKEKYSI